MSVENLCRRSAGVQGTGYGIGGKNLRGSDNCCFKEAGDTVKSDCGLAGCLLVIADYTEGAVVVVGFVKMEMRRCRERGKEEQRCYDDSGESQAPAGDGLRDHGVTLIHAADIVKDLFCPRHARTVRRGS
jgi:hypothetical protein